MRSALEFADLLRLGAPELEPATYVTIKVYSTLEVMMRTPGNTPTSSFLLCSLFNDALCLPQELAFISPLQRNGRLSIDTERSSPRSGSDRRACSFDYRIGDSTFGLTIKIPW